MRLAGLLPSRASETEVFLKHLDFEKEGSALRLRLYLLDNRSRIIVAAGAIQQDRVTEPRLLFAPSDARTTFTIPRGNRGRTGCDLSEGGLGVALKPKENVLRRRFDVRR